MYLSLYCKGSKRVTQGFTVRGSWRLNKDCNIYCPPLLWTSALYLSRSPGAQPEAWGLIFLLSAGFLYHTCHQRITETTGGPEGPFGREWLSQPHLISSYSGPQLSDFLSWLSYIIVQRHSIFRMACLIVIKRKKLSCSSQVTLFRYISLWVYHGIFYLVPFRQPSPPTRFPLITAIGMCHFLPVHHLGMERLAGSKVKIQHSFNVKNSSISNNSVQHKHAV